MDLHTAAALLTTHAQHACTLQREAGAALTLGTKSEPRRLARLAHRAERAVELAALWGRGLTEAIPPGWLGRERKGGQIHDSSTVASCSSGRRMTVESQLGARALAEQHRREATSGEPA